MTSVNSNRKKPIYGIGINDADYRIKGCPHYRVWAKMLTRCYSSNSHKEKPSYIGCSVSKEWHSFMSFRSWMRNQDWEGKHLDKDIILPGNKIYSPKTCVFVSRQINSILTKSNLARGKPPSGYGEDKDMKRGLRFSVEISMNGARVRLGRYETAEEASAVYREAKRRHLLTTACCEPDIRVKQGLYRHSELFR